MFFFNTKQINLVFDFPAIFLYFCVVWAVIGFHWFSLEFHECQLFPKWDLFYATYIRAIVWRLSKYFIRNILDVGRSLVCTPLYAQPAASLPKSQI